MGNLFSRACAKEETTDLEEIVVREVYDFEGSLVNDLSVSKFNAPYNKMSAKTSSISKDVLPDFKATSGVEGSTSPAKSKAWSSISGNQRCPGGLDQTEFNSSDLSKDVICLSERKKTLASAAALRGSQRKWAVLHSYDEKGVPFTRIKICQLPRCWKANEQLFRQGHRGPMEVDPRNMIMKYLQALFGSKIHTSEDTIPFQATTHKSSFDPSEKAWRFT